ncbi:rhodanese-like domain-containing protein [Shewanella fodinae]|jgi:rhodanese-related sulfurtransferase|uniref:rhodanese-like domain-containing protein n=1 Tax=Shewanella fodinae TaxID=552357 RepID=UPI00167B03C6|nr:rhodanese-like domain-containing protein [Shewanella fodinae]MCL2906465.1 rhodanese-like domain-containing protein [Shewanella fodinae]GGY93380.1 sulfurtransferase [Shewanella fodinae]
MSKCCGWVLLLGLTAMNVWAGGGGEPRPAVRYDQELNQISMREAESLMGQPGVHFYDVNTLEIWADGYIPGAVFFNVRDWKKLLPENKNATLVFYCVNRLCTSSVLAARAVMKLGYTDVRQMPDGIYGWRISGRPVAKP